jgi:hypothetical protein
MSHELKAVLKAKTLVGQTNLPKTTGQKTMQEDSLQEIKKHQRNRRNFKDSGSEDQNVVRPKYPTQGSRHTNFFFAPPP